MYKQQKLNYSIQILAAYTQVLQQIDLKQEQKKLLHIQKSLIDFLRQFSYSVPSNKTYKQDNFLKYQYLNMIPLQQLYKKFQLSNTEIGLTQQQAKERLNLNGPNKLPNRYFRWILLIQKICKCIVFSPFAFLLLIGIIFSLVLTNIAIFIILFIIILLNGFIKFSLYQKNNFILRDPQQFISKTTIVIRNGIHRVISNTQLVIGDIIIIQANKNIPADVRIIDNNIIQIDNSSLIGQSQINYFKNSQLLQVNTFQNKNIGFYTTLCKKGRAKAIVIKTGERTLINLLLKLAETQVIKLKFLRNQFLRLEMILVIIGFICSFFFFIIGVIMKQDIDLLNAYMQGIILSFIPLGIYLNLFLFLRLKSAKLLKNSNILFNNISSIQTLGQISCVLLDKSGTLTQNQMMVDNLWFSDQEFLDNVYLESVRNNQNFKQINICAIVSSVADQKLYQQQRNNLNMTQENMINKKEKNNQKENTFVANQYFQIVGSPLECALLKFFKTFQDISLTKRKYPVALNQNNEPLLIKFSSKNKFSLAIVQNHSNNSFYTIYIKGAPQIIWNLCKFVQNNKNNQIKDNKWKEKFQNNIKCNGRKGYKILGLAKKQLPFKQFPYGHFPDIHKLQTLLQQFIFLGLISLKDPVKNNVQNYISDLKQAGIKVIMTTKEQPQTALAIAKQCNIITSKTVNQIMEQQNLDFQDAFNKSDSIVIHGDMLTKFTSEDQGLPQSQKGKQIEKCLRKSQVIFVRLSPFHKHIIVKQCQKLGHVVALIGKETSDLPAIKIADIGILKGNDYIEQKRIADIVLLDNDLGSILIGIKQGRTLYNNLRNIMYFILASKVPFILAFIFSVLLQIPFPATAILVLCIQVANFFTIIFLSLEATEQNIMKKNFINKNQHLITLKLIIQSCICIGLFQAMAGFASYFIVMHDFGFNIFQLFGFSKHSIMIDSGLNNNLPNIRWDNCQVQYISPITGQTVCYSTEAIKYAQTAFLFAIVFTRFICIFTIKFKKKNIISIKMLNIPHLLFAIILQFFLTMIISQVVLFNELLGTRDLVWYQYMIPAIPFGLWILFYEQLKKYFMQNSNARQKGTRLNWFQQNLKW